MRERDGMAENVNSKNAAIADEAALAGRRAPVLRRLMPRRLPPLLRLTPGERPL